MKMGKIYSFIMVLFLSIMLIPSIFAIPGFPHEFYGDVLINNSPAPDGTLISAQITGKTVVTNSQNPVETVNGNFGIDDLPLLVQGSDLEGATIKFYVNGVDSGETRTFTYGGGPTEVNLSVTITQTTPGGGGSSGGGSSGGNGSSSGGSGSSSSTPSTQDTTTTKTFSSVTSIISISELETILKESNLTEEEIQEYIESLEDNFFEIERRLDVKKTISSGTESFISTFTIVIKNTSDKNLENIKIVETIPKEVALDASLITSLYNFRVLVNDPVIEFTIPSLNIGQSINLTYSVNKEVKEEDFLKMKGIITKADVASFSDDKEDDVVIIPPANVEDNYNEPTSLSKSNNVWLWIILILLIIGIVYFLVFGKKKSKKLGR